MVSSTGGVTHTAAGLAAFGRRSAGGVPNVGSEAISKQQQNPPHHQHQQQQHVDPGEQTSTEKEEEEEDVGLSYVHKEIQRDITLDEQPASRGGGVTDLMRTNSSSGPRRPTSQLGLSSSSSSQASIMQAPPYVFSSQSTSTFSQGDTLSEGSIPLNHHHHHHQIGNTSRERISSTVDQPFEFAPTAVKSRLVSSSSSASSSSSNWAVSGPVISGGPMSSSSSSRGNSRNNHTGNGLASALASSAGLRLSKSSLETDQTSSYHHGVPLRTTSSSSSPLGDDNIEVQEEERGIGARVLTAGLPTSFLSPNAPRLRGETINPQETKLRSSSALTSSSSSINTSHAKNALRQQHQLQQEQEREDERKRENEPASSSFLGQERVEYDDLAGEAEPSVTPLPKPRGVLATTGATSRGGGGGRAVVAVGGVVSRNSNQEKSMRSRIRAPSDNQEDEEEGAPEGVHSTFVAPRGNLADNGHARVQLQENPSYPNGDDYAASSSSSHQDGVHVDDEGRGRVRRKGAGAGQLASNNHHHRHLNNNKNNNNDPISSRNINITASEFQQQSGPVAITKLQEAQMRMRQQQQLQQQQPRGGGGGGGGIDSTKIHYTNHQQQIHQRGAASGPIHPDDRSSYINVDIGGPRVAHTINDKLGNRSEQDQLAFSRKARPTHYTPKTLSEFKQANDALGIPNPTSSGGSPHGNRGGSGGGGGGGVDTVGVRNRKSAPPGYYELGKLGPDLSNEDLLKIKAAKERQREYAAQVSTSAREKAAAAASASALNLAANIAAAQNQNSHHQNQSSPSSSLSLQSHSGSYSPDALSQHASIVMQQMHPSSIGGHAAPTSTSLPHAAVSSKRVSKDPAAIEKEKGAFLRERVKEYASRIPIPQPPKSLSVMSMPATSSSVTAAIPSLQSDQVPLHGRRSIVLSGASERRSTSNGGGPLDPISTLEREHELHRQQADRIRADLFLD